MHLKIFNLTWKPYYNQLYFRIYCSKGYCTSCQYGIMITTKLNCNYNVKRDKNIFMKLNLSNILIKIKFACDSLWN